MSRLFLLLAILLLLPAVSGFAQPTAPADTANAMYEHGVNSYFDGNLSRAEMYLNRSVELRPTDPRTHYFLGLTLLRQGRSVEAETTIHEGAAVEAASGKAASVGHALQRVQGSERIEFERIRKAAQTNTVSIADENARLRQEQFDRRQQAVLRKPVHLPLEAFINPVQPDQIAGVLVDRSGATSLAAIEESTTEEPATEDTEVPVAADVGNPFTDDPITTTSADAAPGGVVQRRVIGMVGSTGSSVGRSVSGFVDTVRGLGDLVQGFSGGPPPGMPGGPVPEGFGPGEFGPMEPGGEEPPFGPDEPSSFGPESPGEDSTPPSGEMEENPFGF